MLVQQQQSLPQSATLCTAATAAKKTVAAAAAGATHCSGSSKTQCYQPRRRSRRRSLWRQRCLSHRRSTSAPGATTRQTRPSLRAPRPLLCSSGSGRACTRCRRWLWADCSTTGSGSSSGSRWHCKRPVIMLLGAAPLRPHGWTSHVHPTPRFDTSTAPASAGNQLVHPKALISRPQAFRHTPKKVQCMHSLRRTLAS